MRRFTKWFYVKRHYASKGIADIVCIRAQDSVPQVAFIQCKIGSRVDRKGRDALIKFAKKCGAIPVWASSVKRKIQLLDLRTNQEFTP